MSKAGLLASELDRDLKLSLSNGEWEALVAILEASPEREARRLEQAGSKAVREEILARRRVAT